MSVWLADECIGTSSSLAWPLTIYILEIYWEIIGKNASLARLPLSLSPVITSSSPGFSLPSWSLSIFISFIFWCHLYPPTQKGLLTIITTTITTKKSSSSFSNSGISTHHHHHHHPGFSPSLPSWCTQPASAAVFFAEIKCNFEIYFCRAILQCILQSILHTEQYTVNSIKCTVYSAQCFCCSQLQFDYAIYSCARQSEFQQIWLQLYHHFKDRLDHIRLRVCVQYAA